MIAGVVLASGFSSRMGRSKLSLDLGGRTFLERAAGAATGAASVEWCLVVVKPEDLPLVQALTLRQVEALANPLAAQGQSVAVRLAARRLLGVPACEAAIFAVADQPFLQPEVFDALATAWAAGRGELLVSTYEGQRGNPVLFARRFFPELCELTGDVGGREVIRRHPEVVAEVEMPDPRAGQDIDTWEQFLAAQRDFAAT